MGLHSGIPFEFIGMYSMVSPHGALHKHIIYTSEISSSRETMLVASNSEKHSERTNMVKTRFKSMFACGVVFCVCRIALLLHLHMELVDRMPEQNLICLDFQTVWGLRKLDMYSVNVCRHMLACPMCPMHVGCMSWPCWFGHLGVLARLTSIIQ